MSPQARLWLKPLGTVVVLGLLVKCLLVITPFVRGATEPQGWDLFWLAAFPVVLYVYLRHFSVFGCDACGPGHHCPPRRAAPPEPPA
jgi:hypothetical protein